MPDPKDFLPPPPWEGPPIPRGFRRVTVFRRAPKGLSPPGWEPRKPYEHELSYDLTPEQEMYLVNEVRKVYLGRSLPLDHLMRYAIRYAEADLWVEISDMEAREIARKAMSQMSHKEFIASGKTEAEWDTYATEQNRLSRESGQQRTILMWQGEGVSGNDIANLLRTRGVAIPPSISQGLQHSDTVVSSTSVTGRGMNRAEASVIHKWVSAQLGRKPLALPKAEAVPEAPVSPEATTTMPEIVARLDYSKTVPPEIQTRITDLLSTLPPNAKPNIKRIIITDRIITKYGKPTEGYSAQWIESERIMRLNHKFSDGDFYHEIAHALNPGKSEVEVERLGRVLESRHLD